VSGLSMRMDVSNTPFSCLCRGAEFIFSIYSGGLCVTGNDGECAACGELIRTGCSGPV
jgi:hypothetical protein